MNVNDELLHIVIQVNQNKISHWHPREKTIWHPRVVLGAMYSSKKRCSALRLNAMRSGKKRWIPEFVLPFIYSFWILIMLLLARYARYAEPKLDTAFAQWLNKAFQVHEFFITAFSSRAAARFGSGKTVLLSKKYHSFSSVWEFLTVQFISKNNIRAIHLYNTLIMRV